MEGATKNQTTGIYTKCHATFKDSGRKWMERMPLLLQLLLSFRSQIKIAELLILFFRHHANDRDSVAVELCNV